MLLSFNADINKTRTLKTGVSSTQEVPPLYWAFLRCQTRIAELLILNGAKLGDTFIKELTDLLKQKKDDQYVTNFEKAHYEAALKLLEKVKNLEEGDIKAWKDFIVTRQDLHHRESVSFGSVITSVVSSFKLDAAIALDLAIRDGNINLVKMLSSLKDLGKDENGNLLRFPDIVFFKNLQKETFSEFARKIGYGEIADFLQGLVDEEELFKKLSQSLRAIAMHT